MHFFCSDPEASGRQTSYMLYLRVDPTLGTGTGTAEIYRYNNNSFRTSEGGFFTMNLIICNLTFGMT